MILWPISFLTGLYWLLITQEYSDGIPHDIPHNAIQYPWYPYEIPMELFETSLGALRLRSHDLRDAGQYRGHRRVRAGARGLGAGRHRGAGLWEDVAGEGSGRDAAREGTQLFFGRSGEHGGTNKDLVNLFLGEMVIFWPTIWGYRGCNHRNSDDDFGRSWVYFVYRRMGWNGIFWREWNSKNLMEFWEKGLYFDQQSEHT